ncbi:putative S-adenosyl-L-methionine-dependent methyltransferase-domain-containing protein [Phyllosticta citrichinensis]|uniref:Protein arginine methyltransferase NDUFAF7 n=1 Tax=Phyllosticta citrichinensis TaxID=1130410 RepID=A0ABR1XWN0_9PEZI
MLAATNFTHRALSRTLARPQNATRIRYLIRRWSSTSSGRYSTPLAKTLAQAIDATGPIPVATYMRQCLTAPESGYYTRRIEGADQFGQKGDFVTSPEISQIFGELVGLWMITEWMSQGRKSSGIQLMEVGPGRGTLMDDILRTIRNFKPFSSLIETVYLVEASPSLRDAQQKLLCGDNPMKETEIGNESVSKYSDIRIVWTEDIRLVPKDDGKTPFIVAHEFFDALPVHVFQNVKPSPTKPAEHPKDFSQEEVMASSNMMYTRPRDSNVNEWRELLVSPTSPDSTHASLNTPISLRDHTPVPDFQLILSKGPTPHSMYLPQTSPRYKALQSTPDSVIEISPESAAYASDFAVRIGGTAAISGERSSGASGSASLDSKTTFWTKSQPCGAALILDYGPASTIPTNSLRGIRGHNAVSPFALPGEVDVSADVDFTALAESAINASPNVEVHGPVDQSHFLESMGIRERAQMLLQHAESRTGVTEEEKRQFRERIDAGWKRLVNRGPNGMGKLYKVLAIVPYRPDGAVRRPVGFGGDVQV